MGIYAFGWVGLALQVTASKSVGRTFTDSYGTSGPAWNESARSTNKLWTEIFHCPYLSQPTGCNLENFTFLSPMRVSKSGRRATALSLYTSQNEDGITILNPSLKLERFVLDKDGPFAELHKVIEEQHQETEGPPFISNLPDFEQIAQNLVSIMGHQSKTPSGDICKALIQNNIMDISSLSCMWTQ